MGGYKSFAWFYDRLQAQVDYEAMARLFHGFICKYSSEKEVVVDLACGTGTLCEKMEKLGYDVIGVDLSQDMLNEALEKKYDRGLNISYLCQSMTELDLMGASDVILCTLDSINHLSGLADVEKTFERVSMFVCDGGMFIFDVNSIYKHRKILGNNSFCAEVEGIFCTWQSELHGDDSVTISLDFFEEEKDGRYSRYGECFDERVYEDSVLDGLLEKYGFEIIGKYDDFSENPVNDESQRILYVCKRMTR